MYSGPSARHDCVWMSGGTGPVILNLGTAWRWLVSLTFRQFGP